MTPHLEKFFELSQEIFNKFWEHGNQVDNLVRWFGIFKEWKTLMWRLSMSLGHFWLTYPLLAWRLSSPSELSYKICEFRYSYFIQFPASTSASTFDNVQTFHSFFRKTQAITGGVPVNFLTFVPTNCETPWVPFCSKFKLRFHLDAFGDHEHSAPAGRCGHAKRRCLKTDTTRLETAPWQELLALDLTSLDRPCCIKGACECCARAQRSGGKGEGVERTMGV